MVEHLVTKEEVVTSLSKIRDQHALTLSAAKALHDATRASASIPPGFAKLRLDFAAASRDTLVTFQDVIERVRLSVNAQSVGLDGAIRADREMRRIYSQHLSHWSPSNIDRNYSAYRIDVAALVARIEPHIRLLEAEVYEPAAQSGLIPRA